MQVNYVEFARSLRDRLEHREKWSDVIADCRIEPKRLRVARLRGAPS